MPNSWSPPEPFPFPESRHYFRTQIPGAPEGATDKMVLELGYGAASGPTTAAEPVPSAIPVEVLTRIEAVEASNVALAAENATLKSQVSDLGSQITALIERAASSEAAFSKLEAALATATADAAVVEAIQKRLAAVEARPAGAPARTPVPPRAVSA